MKSIAEKLFNISFDHALWLNELAYALGEIDIYEKRILDLLDAYSETAEIEELEELGIMLKKFIDQRETVNELKDQIIKHMGIMKRKIQSNGELKAITNAGHHKVREQMESYRVEYNILKETFHRFAAFNN